MTSTTDKVYCYFAIKNVVLANCYKDVVLGFLLQNSIARFLGMKMYSSFFLLQTCIPRLFVRNIYS